MRPPLSNPAPICSYKTVLENYIEKIMAKRHLSIGSEVIESISQDLVSDMALNKTKWKRAITAIEPPKKKR